MEAGEEAVHRRRRIRLPLRRPRWATVIIGFILVVLLLIVIIWTQRRQLATDYIERELERRGVQATYRVTRVGFRTQQMEDLVIGDPRRPDLTAKFVEVKISWGFRRPKIGLVKARGVRMFGRIVDERLSFGEVDKLLPPPTGKPFEFPDLNVDLADAALAIDTKSGRIAAAVEGVGNLADGFRGEMAVRSSELLLGRCAVGNVVGYAKVAIDDRSPAVDGPLRADRLLCPGAGVDLTKPVIDLNAKVSETLNAWRGNAGLAMQRARIGANGAAGVSGRITFDGMRKLTRGAMNLSAVQTRVGALGAARTNLRGRYAISLKNGDISMLADTSATGVTGGNALVGPIVGAIAGAEGTPLEPIGAALATAVRRAAGGMDASASLRMVNTTRYGAVRVERLSAESRSGARIGLNGGEGITYYWPSGAMRVDGEFGLTGGGFPATRLSLNQPRGGAPMRGEARIAPMAAGNARLALAPIRFRAGRNGTTRIETAAVMSGPIGDGYVRGLSLPIAGYFGGGAFAIGERCVAVSFDALQISNFRFGRTRLPLCPTGRALVWKTANGPVQGGAEIRPARISGRLGLSPFSFSASRFRFNLADKSFTSSDAAIRLGGGGYVNRIDMGTFNGRMTAEGAAGTFAGANGAIANVPLNISNARGDWRLAGGDLSLNGSLTVSDQADPPRFWPLVSNDFELTLRNNQIDARGWLIDPDTGTRVTEATIRHSLNSGSGNAVLDVPGITFAVDGYQPEELTRLTTGVVALVDGTLVGRGQINWDRNGTSSTGTFSTQDMDLAAPFGPVEGLTTTVNFTDLLGLTSAPGQVAQVDLIRTGIDVVDGTIRYQLLPDSRVRVESGVWPFMGGELRLRETLLDFSQPSTKRLTFDVIGLDAAIFIQQMEFANIEATGIFDGVLPMEFDQTGGRIVNGRLEARPGGGTLSYVGVVTEADLGAYGLLAFNALKSLRYDKFIIGLNGSLEGEFLADIELDGIATNTAPQGGIAGYIISQIAKIPFEFNIAIRGPFRALIATARSFEDPSQIIQPVLPPELQDLPVEVIQQDEQQSQQTQPQQESVQPQESETVQ
ncbi:MAG TPA: YdbH domain-containing protein [Allosphingosinicella sp.]|uniref:intermembrane phospholipid transport protein YdbH family protein n=1 Tax=Allosphingosinicella sp. TaxID=2823234 RepID=UPI002ED7F9C9